MPITYTESLPESCALAALLDTTGWFRNAPLTVDTVAAALAGSWTALSAYDGDLLVGFGRVISDGILHALIVELIVLPEYQRQGIGSALLDRLIARCREAGIRCIQLFAAHGKAGFYERHGFTSRLPEAPGMELPYL